MPGVPVTKQFSISIPKKNRRISEEIDRMARTDEIPCGCALNQALYRN